MHSIARLLPLLASLLLSAVAATGVQEPLRTFRLRFQLANFVVPTGETWRLRWRSPYHAGDICPTYDVRVIEGHARIGTRGEAQVQPYANFGEKPNPLDICATSKEVTVWLDSGVRFATANNRLRIEVSVFANTPPR